jgi:hypothetical protein
MAIDKIIPKGLSSDLDERLIKPGFMPDATNITLSEGGSGTANILKNCKGTIPGESLSTSDALLNIESGYYVIGEVSDPQRGFIYFFAVDVERLTSYIYQYNVKTDIYRLVISDTRLGFRPEYFVKADVVNGAFQQDGKVQTILYFTDNVNPPRKINVDRALAGDYNLLNNEEWDYSVNSIKAASILPPRCRFETTEELQHNNFKKSAFQFATQVIYVDGEESAISPYSKLSYSKILNLHGVESDKYSDISSQVSINADNTCVVNINLPQSLINTDDVKKVRLIAREGNSGPFFIVDEFNPNQDLTKSVYGQNISVYSSSSKEYRFFNDTLGSIVPSFTEDKLYDNVPLQARSQTVVGNRLMYGNYTEGRPNVNVRGQINVEYGESGSVSSSIINDSAVQDSLNTRIAPEIRINLNDLFVGYSNDDVISAGTVISISADLSLPTVSNISSQNDIIDISVNLYKVYTDPFSVVQSGLVQYSSSSLVGDFESSSDSLFSAEYVASTDMSYSEFIGYFLEVIDNVIVQSEYTSVSNNPNFVISELSTNQTWDQANIQDVNLDLKNMSGLTFEWIFQTVLENNTIVIYPDLERVYLNTDQLINQSQTFFGTFGSNDLFINKNFNIPIADVFVAPIANELTLIEENVPGSYDNETGVDNFDFSCIGFSALSGFKSGSLHKLGIVYYDKYNRSGFVNDIGSAYVGWYNDHDRLLPGVDKTEGQEILEFETNAGPASLKVTLFHEPPSWARAFQFVYPGRSSMDNFIQYSVVGAFAARKGDFPSTAGEYRDIDSESKRIYVSIDTLGLYRDQKSTLRDYSFTEGDKLRVKSISSQSSLNMIPTSMERIYPSATDGSVVEFDIVGVELLTNDVTNPIAYNSSSPGSAHGALSDMDERFTGEFLVLEASNIAGGATSSGGSQIKYIGFDWNHVIYENTLGATQIEYADGSLPTQQLNYWQRQCVAEIYSPKKSLANEFYYEIGEVIDLSTIRDIDDAPSAHGPSITITSGDIHYRPVPCKTADYVDPEDDGTYEFRWYVKDDWAYKTEVLEDSSPSEIISDAIWNKGRAHVKFERSATVRRFNGLTYSDAYEEDVANLSLSSFNPTLANFGSLESKYGAVNYIYNYGKTGELLALQENKLSVTNVDSRILLDAAGGQNVALSTNVIGSTNYFVGDYGCGDHPEAVLVYDNDVFFVDVSRRKVLRLSGGQMVPISDKDMASTFNDVFKRWETDGNAVVNDSPNKVRKIVSGYDPDEDTYYVTFYADSNLLRYFQVGGSSGYNFSDIYSSVQFNGYTLSYNVGDGFWQSKHSFIPTIYSNQNNTMYSCKYVYDDSDPGLVDSLKPLLFHKHDDLSDVSETILNRTTFYNQNSSISDFTVVSNVAPSMVKVYNALSYEGSKRPDSVSIESSNGSFNDNIGTLDSGDGDFGQYQFVEKEDSFYVVLPRDISDKSTAQYSGIGFCSLAESDSITIDGSLIGVSIPIGAQLVNESNIDISNSTTQVTTVVGVEGNKIFVSQVPFAAQGQNIILVSNSYFDGDAIRGHYTKIKSEYNDSNIYEVYCVNAHFTNSNLHHTGNN